MKYINIHFLFPPTCIIATQQLQLQASLFLERLCKIWDSAAKGQRKPWGFKECIPVHQSCAMFWHFFDVLSKRAPSADFAEAVPKIREQFMHGSMDNELCQVCDGSVPPGDIMAVTAFRTGCERPVVCCSLFSKWFFLLVWPDLFSDFTPGMSSPSLKPVLPWSRRRKLRYSPSVWHRRPFNRSKAKSRLTSL